MNHPSIFIPEGGTEKVWGGGSSPSQHTLQPLARLASHKTATGPPAGALSQIYDNQTTSISTYKFMLTIMFSI